MLNIKFELGGKEYRLKSSTYDFSLYSIGYVKEGENKGKETENFIGYFANIFDLDRYMPNKTLRNTDLEFLSELKEKLNDIINGLEPMTKYMVAEAFIKPDESKSYQAQIKKLLDENEKLRNDNTELKKKIKKS